jgi:uncharacterized membrane protein YfcA
LLATIFAIGAAGGVLSGMLGIGGAVVLLPLLTTFAGMSLKQASNITIVQVVASSLIGWLAYRQGQLVHLRLALFMGIASALGGLVGGYASAYFTNRQLEWVFLVVVGIAISLLFIPVNELPQPDGSMPPFNPLLAITSGAVVGMLAGLLGAGGGFLIVPLMIAVIRVPTRMAIGTSAAIKLISSAFAYAGKLLSSEIPMDQAAALVLAAVPCTYLGALLARRVSPRSLRILLGIVLAATAARGVVLLLPPG